MRLYRELHYCAEDAYITFRASRNWLWFGAPTFNPHESSWPASSPIWTGWMSLGLSFGANAEWWARIGSLTAECLLLVAIHRMAGKKAAIAFGIMLAGFQCAIALSLSGIEMFVMVAAFAWALLGSRVALAVLIASRPEGFILGAIALWPNWKRNLMPAVIGVIPWLLMALLTGRWAPAGVTAKVGTYGLHLFAGTKWLSTMFWPWIQNLEGRSMVPLGLGALLCAPFFRGKRPVTVFALTGLGLLMAYYVSGAVFFFWYMTLPICAAMACVAVASSRWKRWYVPAILIAVASWTNNYPLRRWDYQHRNLAVVAKSLPDHGTVVMDAVGIVGWEKPHLRFVDVIGLCSPRSESMRRSQKDGWMTELIQTEMPDALVLKLHEVEHNLADAGAGKPFKDTPMLVGSLINIKGNGRIACGITGYRCEQIDQDVVFILDEPKPDSVRRN